MAVPPKSRPLLRTFYLHPWLLAARKSPALRKWCDQHGLITPHFTWKSYACTDLTPVPKSLHANAIRLHWRLEILRHRLGDVPMRVDGPYRTKAHNRKVGGAADSRHVHADAADFFRDQVERWAAHAHMTISDVVSIASRTFYNGGVGNETSGTLHVDSRGYKARFVTWKAGQ